MSKVMDSRAKTARKNVGTMTPVVYAYLLRTKQDGHGSGNLLDYGCGYGMYRQALSQAGYNWFGWDLCLDRFEQVWDVKAAGRTACFETVALSNVLNVQETLEQFQETLVEAADCVRYKGRLVLNYPAVPRRMPSINWQRFVLLVQDTLEDAGYQFQVVRQENSQQLLVLQRVSR